MSRSPVLPRHAHRGLWLLFTAFVAALVFFVLRSLFPTTPTVDYRLQQQTINAQQNQSKLLANHLSTVGPPATEISKGNASAEPTRVAPTTPAPTYVGVQGPAGPGPTNAQVLTAVGHYFAEHPPKPPVSAAQITAQAASFVAKYLRAHPAPKGDTGASGSPGATGVPGPGPSDQQIAAAVQDYLPAAVAVYLAANPPASGPAGSTGPEGPQGSQGPQGSPGVDGSPGRGITHVNVQRQDDGSCDLITTYTDGSTEDAGAVSCPSPPPSSSSAP